MTTFQRARSEEQRAIRRQAILTTATAMLAEMPVADLSLNELSRRVGLAKSNVLKYFESREAVLLEVANREMTAWIDDLAAALGAAVGGTDVDQRVELLVSAIVRTLAARPVLCDLLSAQASILERNISADVALAFKRSTLAGYKRLIEIVTATLPELGPDSAARLVMVAGLLAGSVWTHAHPAAPIVAAYEADPAVGALRMEFEPVLRESLITVLRGLLR